MPTSRAFAYNPSSQSPTGATQIGNLAVQSLGWTSGSGNLYWLNGPDEELGYVIAYNSTGPRTSGSGSTPISGTSFGFRRSTTLSDLDFISLAQNMTGQTFSNASSANTYLKNNNYWTSYNNIVTDSLILYLDASNPTSYSGSGTTWTDLSPSIKNGTLVNGVGYTTTSGKSMVFDGVNDYITIPQLTANQITGSYSFSVWVRFTSTQSSSHTTNYMLMEAQNTLLGGVDNYLYLLSNASVPGTNGRMGWQSFNPQSFVYSTTNTWNSDTWYNVCCTYDISTGAQRLYVNGLLEGSGTQSGLYFNTNSYFSLGAYSVPPVQWFLDGRINKFLVYNKTLSQAEVSQNYYATIQNLI